MNLLSRFDAVTVTPDGRITGQDKAFCAAHQTAYDAARASLKELVCIWESIALHSLASLFGYNRFESDLIVFPGCHKPVKLRMFKNGRIDLTFAETIFAPKFAEDYLGTAC